MQMRDNSQTARRIACLRTTPVTTARLRDAQRDQNQRRITAAITLNPTETRSIDASGKYTRVDPLS